MCRPLLVALLLAVTGTASLAWQATLHFQAPAGWRVEQPKSSMRLAQFTLPKGAGDTEDAQVVIFYFGQSQGGSVQANLERWAGQMGQAGGRPGTLEDGKTTNFTANGHQVTVLDIAGTYASDMMMAGSTPRTRYRMKAAVVETAGGPYFVKLTGPDKTVTKWDASFTAFLKTVVYK